MNMHTPQQIRQHDEAMARKGRLFAPSQAAMEVVPKHIHDAEVMRLRQRHYESSAKHRKVSAALTEAEVKIASLELRLADTQATLLRQAETICGYQSRDVSDAQVSARRKGLRLPETGLEPVRRSVRSIVDEILADYPGISWDDIKGIRRERRLIEPRHRCMAAVYDERKDLSLPAIGKQFHRDHTVIIHAVRKIAAQRASA